jgi:16S rRNA (cytosine1402-N4)-methyltransferase
MPREALEALDPAPGKLMADLTIGPGAHAEAIMMRILPGGRLFAMDRDPQALALARERLSRFGEAVSFAEGDFAEIEAHASRAGFQGFDGILMDLGASSLQLDSPERGFSFRQAGPLDMRMSPSLQVTAEDLVNGLSEKDLADLLYSQADERHSRRIARRIVMARRVRRIRTTLELADIVSQAVPGRRGRIHPATRTFQALRVAVNDEIGSLERGLRAASRCLRRRGRLAVISFQSKESRCVKLFFRDEERQGRMRRLKKHAIVAGDAEIAANPRARSAELRIAERVDRAGSEEGGIA